MAVWLIDGLSVALLIEVSSVWHGGSGGWSVGVRALMISQDGVIARPLPSSALCAA